MREQRRAELARGAPRRNRCAARRAAGGATWLGRHPAPLGSARSVEEPRVPIALPSTPSQRKCPAAGRRLRCEAADATRAGVGELGVAIAWHASAPGIEIAAGKAKHA